MIGSCLGISDMSAATILKRSHVSLTDFLRAGTFSWEPH
jgi:hypothetical protein